MEQHPKKSLISRIANALADRINQNLEERKLRKNPIYTREPKTEPLKVTKKKEGDFSSLEKRLDNDSLILLIFGKRGSGKSALGFRILENVHGKTKRKCFVLGVKKGLMPKWIAPLDNIENAQNGGVILVDEGALSFGSRESMQIKNRELSKLLAIARHKNLTLIFVTQNTGLIDKNVLKLADTLFIKEGSLLQLEMERAEIKKFYEKAKTAFAKFEGEKNRYAYVLDADFEGAIEHSLPSFWSDGLSKNQASVDAK
jgi:hypothetical protein